MSSGLSDGFIPLWFARPDGQIHGGEHSAPATSIAIGRSAAAATELLLAKGKTVKIIAVRLADYLEWLQNTHRINTVATRLRYPRWLATQNGQSATVLPLPARVLSDPGGEG